MDRMLLRIFQNQVRDQCRFVLMSVQLLNAGLEAAQDEEQSPEDRNQAIDQVWYALQNLVTAAANISKALWGEKGKLVNERQPLRESLGVPDDSPLRPTTLRNHFEHFDSRLDVWDNTSTNHIYIDRNIGPPNMVEGDIEDVDRFRSFDPARGVVTFWGQEHDVQALAQAAGDLFSVADREASKPHWED